MLHFVDEFANGPDDPTEDRRWDTTETAPQIPTCLPIARLHTTPPDRAIAHRHSHPKDTLNDKTHHEIHDHRTLSTHREHSSEDEIDHHSLREQNLVQEPNRALKLTKG